MIYSSEELLSKEIIRDVRKVEKKLESEKIDIKEIRRFLLEYVFHNSGFNVLLLIVGS